jgi:hypothetical protein
MYSRTDTRQRAALNQRHPCAVRTCPYRRNWTSQYCAAHRTRHRRYGHPLGRHVSKDEHASYRKLARRLFRRFADHPGLLAAKEVVAALLSPQQNEPRRKPLRLNPHWQLWRELTRLRSEGVTPDEALETIVGVWLLSLFEPEKLPDDTRLDYAIAQAVFHLRPLEVATSRWIDSPTGGYAHNVSRQPGGLAAGLLGRRIRFQLTPLMVNLLEFIESEHQEKTKKAMALREPFTTNITEA